MKNQLNNNVPYQKGFTLVELMVSMLIGLILLAGLSSVFVSSKKSYTANDSLARLQENARISVQILTRTLRSTGYFGCADDIKSVTSSLNDDAGYAFRIGARLEGTTYTGAGSSFWFPSGATVDIPAPVQAIVGTDMITTRFLDGATAINMNAEMNSSSANFKIDPGSGAGINDGDIMMLTDCSSADVFQVTKIDPKTDFDLIVHNAGAGTGTPGNSTQKMSKAYKGESKLMKFRTVVFFLGDGTDGEPALFRQSLETNASGVPVMETQELVQGVEDFQIRYGETTNGDRVPNQYVNAAGVTDWDNVITMRMGIVARSQANLQTTDKKAVVKELDSASYDVDGDGVKEYDMSADLRTTNGVSWRAYQRRVFRNTILLRNLQ